METDTFFMSQVKVWFQNRRTKFKRVRTEEEEDEHVEHVEAPGSTPKKVKPSHHVDKWRVETGVEAGQNNDMVSHESS